MFSPELVERTPSIPGGAIGGRCGDASIGGEEGSGEGGKGGRGGGVIGGDGGNGGDEGGRGGKYGGQGGLGGGEGGGGDGASNMVDSTTTCETLRTGTLIAVETSVEKAEVWIWEAAALASVLT